LPVRIYGDGRSRRDYVYIDDVVDAIVLALRTPTPARHILNIGSGATRSVLEVVEAIERVTGRVLPREFVPERNTDVVVSSLDISQALAVLDWKPKTGFYVGLERVIAAIETG
jgi:UDP-glucose 4-epimerase